MTWDANDWEDTASAAIVSSQPIILASQVSGAALPPFSFWGDDNGMESRSLRFSLEMREELLATGLVDEGLWTQWKRAVMRGMPDL